MTAGGYGSRLGGRDDSGENLYRLRFAGVNPASSYAGYPTLPVGKIAK